MEKLLTILFFSCYVLLTVHSNIMIVIFYQLDEQIPYINPLNTELNPICQ